MHAQQLCEAKDRVASPPPLGTLGRCARAVSIVMMAYWLVFALVAPVLNIDSQHYNLSRLDFAMRGGLFGNPQWTSLFQVCYPWSFDAVHLPFLLLGWGYALPSWLCLLGILVVCRRLIGRSHGPDAAWLGVLSVLSLFMVVQQASSTKTDLAVVFCGAVWLYARNGYMLDGRRRHLAAMALALGLMSGTKVFGLFIGFLLGLSSLWLLRQQWRRLLGFSLACAGTLIFWGSVETYVESYRLYDYPLGPPVIVQGGRNDDGVRGAVANVIRYSGGLIYPGPTLTRTGFQAGNSLAEGTRNFLSVIGLSDAGLMAGQSDANLTFLHTPFEEYCGYGPVGTLALVAMLLSLLVWRVSHAWWRLSFLGLFSLFALGWLLGYNVFNPRYIMIAVVPATLGFVLLVWSLGGGSMVFRAVARWGLLVVLASCAVAAPLLSFVKGPEAIVLSLLDRERFAASCYPLAHAFIEELRWQHANTPGAGVYVIVNGVLPVLPYLANADSSNGVRITPMLASEFSRRRAEGWIRSGDLVAETYPSGLPGLVTVRTLEVVNPYAPFGAPLRGRVCRVQP